MPVCFIFCKMIRFQTGNQHFPRFSSAHPQGRGISLLPALGRKRHAGQPERPAKEEEQEVRASLQNERKTPGKRSVCSIYYPAALPVNDIC